MHILIDTNVLLRTIQPGSADCAVARAAIRECRKTDRLTIVPQVVYELWVVLTRPTDVNGLGMSSAAAEQRIGELLELVELLRDERRIYDHWMELVSTHEISGKKAHDTRLVAAMQRHAITKLLSFNTGDFSKYQDIEVLSPRKFG